MQKPNGTLSPRVKKVGAEKFALVCVDPAKHRSEWMMADYMGNLLIEPRTLEHQAAQFDAAALLIRQAQQEHGILDLIITIERTGSYHRAPQHAFAHAGFETRVIHPFATKQYRLPADAGNKTDQTDLFAQHRAAIAGFGLREPVLDELYRRLQLRVRHRRDLVEKSSAIACQIREHLHLALPGYAELFSDLLSHPAALAIARRCPSPQDILQLGSAGLTQLLREQKIRFQATTLEKIVVWAAQAARQQPDPDRALHHHITGNLADMYQSLRTLIVALQRDIASDLVRTPYVRLLAIVGIHVVSAADFAGEMGPIANYGNANAITGRSGLYPSRYQSDLIDHANGALVRQCNRRLRATILRIADNLVRFNNHYRARAAVLRAAKTDERAIRVKVAKNFTRLAFAAVVGDQPLRHSCCATRDSIIEKLRAFHLEHRTPFSVVQADLEAAVAQLLPDTRQREAEIVASVLEQQAQRRRGPTPVGELLFALLARLRVEQPQATNSNTNTAQTEPPKTETQPPETENRGTGVPN